ncbi:MAG: glycogen debranching enzyme GlgX, partial [Pseudomonadota bacterium]|nr:glycogen debranching enzyme GlgX [Pseudomonadota bacterium]
RRQRRNFLATLLLSQGVPMLLSGDEMGRTQFGNNNAYCQDNEISWQDWSRSEQEGQLLEFTSQLIALRRAHPVFRRQHFFQGRQIRRGDLKDITWLRPDGQEMEDEEWNHAFARSLGVFLGGEMLGEYDRRGRPVRDDNFLLLLNAHHEPVPFTLITPPSGTWSLVFDTYEEPAFPRTPSALNGGHVYDVRERSIVLLREVGDDHGT